MGFDWMHAIGEELPIPANHRNAETATTAATDMVRIMGGDRSPVST